MANGLNPSLNMPLPLTYPRSHWPPIPFLMPFISQPLRVGHPHLAPNCSSGGDFYAPHSGSTARFISCRRSGAESHEKTTRQIPPVDPGEAESSPTSPNSAGPTLRGIWRSAQPPWSSFPGLRPSMMILARPSWYPTGAPVASVRQNDWTRPESTRVNGSSPTLGRRKAWLS